MGSVVSIDSDSLSVRGDTAEVATRVPIASITGLEISVAQRSRWGRGMAIGFAGGALIGAVYGGLAAGTGPGEIDLPTEHAVGLTAAIFGAGGALLGLVVGAGMRTDEWQPLGLGSLELSVRGTPAGQRRMYLSLSLHPPALP